jgi:hypothetical protein
LHVGYWGWNPRIHTCKACVPLLEPHLQYILHSLLLVIRSHKLFAQAGLKLPFTRSQFPVARITEVSHWYLVGSQFFLLYFHDFSLCKFYFLTSFSLLFDLELGTIQLLSALGQSLISCPFRKSVS